MASGGISGEILVSLGPVSPKAGQFSFQSLSEGSTSLFPPPPMFSCVESRLAGGNLRTRKMRYGAA
jgi:hypothetical protein